MAADTERCPDCDAPLATKGDLGRDDPNKCWRRVAWGLGVCTREPVPWPARALAAEADVARLTGERDDAFAAGYLDEGRNWKRALDAARTMAAAEAARAERLTAVFREFINFHGGTHSHPDDCENLKTCADHRLAFETDAVLKLTPTAALAEHDAALLARVRPVIEAARAHLAAARAWIDVDPDDPREINLALALSTAVANLRAAIAAYDAGGKEGT